MRTISSIVVFLSIFVSFISAANTLYQNALILCTDVAGQPDQALGVLQGYGVPITVQTIPQAGAALPALETISGANSAGNYGLIIVIGLVTYNMGGSVGWASAITAAQWTTLYNYQTKYGVRMIHLDAFPGTQFGTVLAPGPGGCCSTGEQTVTLTDTTFIPTAGLKSSPLSTVGLWHYPATISDPTNGTVAFLQFGTNAQYPATSVAGVRQKIANGAGFREQMALFVEGGSWSLTTNYLAHIWFHWGYRGLYNGYRRVSLNTQVDDMFLDTDIYNVTTGTDVDGQRSRVSTADLDNHIAWLPTLQAKMNPGSVYFMEIGFNGNGNEDYANNIDATCQESIGFDDPISPESNAEFKKPLGTGISSWPNPVSYTINKQCTLLDPLAAYIQTAAKRDAFAWLSHTFTHEALDNATFYDVNNEITFNQKHAVTLGLTAANKWSSKSFIPPAITGLHNGDAIKAFLQNGILSGVGDNTRPLLRNPVNTHWPLITTVAASGYAGFTILPRWATRIYYNCGNIWENADQWRHLSPSEAATGAGDIYALLEYEKQGQTSNLLALHRDPFMFHQINLRVTDVTATTIAGVTKNRSLLQMWAETIVTQFVALTKWPLISVKQDDLYTIFTQRMTRDNCAPKVALTYTVAAGVTKISGFTVSCTNNNCAVPIPVTIPSGTVTSLQGSTTEQIGSDPMTIWVTLSGAAKTFTLTAPVTI